MWDEEFDVARCPCDALEYCKRLQGREEGTLTEVSDSSAAEVPYKAYVRDEEAYYEYENEWCCPGGDFVGSDAEVRVRFMRLQRLGGE